MDKWLKTPWFIRVISLLLAIGLYVTVSLNEQNATRPDGTIFPKTSNEVATINNVPLQVHLDEEKYVVQGVPQYVSVSIQGSTSVVEATARQRNFDIFVDLEGLEEGTHEVKVQHQGISNQLSVQMEPETLEVTIEERATSEFKAEVEMLNYEDMDDGFILGEPIISPETVSVTGSKSEVDKVAMVKAIVDLTGVTDEIDIRNAPVKVYDQQGNELNVYVNPSTVHVQIPLEVGRKEVPLTYTTTGELGEGISLESISLEQDTVMVFGQAEVLNGIESIDNLIIDLTNITEDKTIELVVPIPPGVTRVEPITVNATINVEPTETVTIENIPIQVTNLEDGKTVSFIEPEEETVAITVFGTAQQLKDISEEQFSASINVEGFFNGEFETVIDLKGPDGIMMKPNYNNARVRIE
ncbi:YbbR domain-containing protein [Salirhabdus euzebyi]|uniref:YbbR domain-containing protein n=1 Tax=Salirhabdus euzebyi TaxID=394506 RepID=A0A841Q6G8_9BACI|nr:CdaR family protein [Salirhabdus euzebyi]MBB6454006.1 YbbR domain-containing protein [Salirhabdus euzebyi]